MILPYEGTCSDFFWNLLVSLKRGPSFFFHCMFLYQINSGGPPRLVWQREIFIWKSEQLKLWKMQKAPSGRDLLLYSHAQIHCWCRSQAMLISVWIGVYICRASFVGVLYGAAALSTTNVAVPMIAHSIANLIAAVQWKLENKKEIETWQSSRAHWNASYFSCPCNTSMYSITMSKLQAV